MSAKLLREAAKLMRERAEGTTQGPWEAKGNRVHTVAVSKRAGYEGLGLHDDVAHLHMTTGNFQSEARNAAHIASWHPAVALAVAEMLEAMAVWADDWAPGEPPSVAPYQSALAVARAYLGRES